MSETEIKRLLDARITLTRAKELLIALVKVPSPQTALLEDEPLLKAFITSAIEPRLRGMGFADVLSAVKGLRIQSLHRCRSDMPASRAIRSSSEGHT